jgi:hypothetical protein
MRRIAGCAVLAALLWGCSGGGEPPQRTSPPKGSDAFAALEAEIFAPRCVHPGCHGGDSPAAGLNLTKGSAYAALVGVHAQRRPDRLLVKPGDPEGSYLVQRLSAGGDTPLMPMTGKRLSDADLERVRAWIRDGAKQ